MAGQKFTRLQEAHTPGKWDDLEPLLEDEGITPRFLIVALKNIAEYGEKDRDKLKAIDMLCKLSGIKPPERIMVSGYDGLKITFGSDDSA